LLRRGGTWNPTFFYTRNGRDWLPAGELARHGGGAGPYSKCVAGRGGTTWRSTPSQPLSTRAGSPARYLQL